MIVIATYRYRLFNSDSLNKYKAFTYYANHNNSIEKVDLSKLFKVGN